MGDADEGGPPLPRPNAVYWRVYLGRDGVTVVCLQHFDEADYRAAGFYRDAAGVRPRFDTEAAALVFLNATFRRDVIDPDCLSPNHPSFLLAGDESALRGDDFGG